MNAPAPQLELRETSVDVIEPGARARVGAVACELGRHIRFDTELLESFSSMNWQALVYDALVVAAAVEFCDRRLPRSTMNWGRRFDLRIPVHDVERWSERRVKRALIEAAELVTGDKLEIEFQPRLAAAPPPAQSRIVFPYDGEAVIAFSEGMNSCAVAGLEGARLGSRLVRVRIGNKKPDIPSNERGRMPFAAVPYSVRTEVKSKETSARSRGFKFALVSAIAAYLIKAPCVIVPESGQGALAPALLPGRTSISRLPQPSRVHGEDGRICGSPVRAEGAVSVPANSGRRKARRCEPSSKPVDQTAQAGNAPGRAGRTHAIRRSRVLGRNAGFARRACCVA